MGRICINCKLGKEKLSTANGKLRTYPSMFTAEEKQKWQEIKEKNKDAWNLVKDPYVCTDCIPASKRQVSKRSEDARKSMAILRLKRKVVELKAKLKAKQPPNYLEKFFDEHQVNPIIQALVFNEVINTKKLPGARRYSIEVTEFSKCLFSVSPRSYRLLKEKYGFTLPTTTALKKTHFPKSILPASETSIEVANAVSSIKSELVTKSEELQPGEVVIASFDVNGDEVKGEEELYETYEYVEEEMLDDEPEQYEDEEHYDQDEGEGHDGEEDEQKKLVIKPTVVIGFNSQHKPIKKEYVDRSGVVWTT